MYHKPQVPKALLLVFLCQLLLLSSCYKDKEDLLYGNTVCDTTMVSFSNDIMPILSTQCATIGCHVAGGSGTGLLENYNQVKAKVDDGSLHLRVVANQDMPPSSLLTGCQILHIEKWIEDGAPDN